VTTPYPDTFQTVVIRDTRYYKLTIKHNQPNKSDGFDALMSYDQQNFGSIVTDDYLIDIEGSPDVLIGWANEANALGAVRTREVTYVVDEPEGGVDVVVPYIEL
jgi:hypothetical protein